MMSQLSQIEFDPQNFTFVPKIEILKSIVTILTYSNRAKLTRCEQLTISTKKSVVIRFVRACVRRLAPIPAGESQDVTNKSCSICLKDDPWGPWRSRTAQQVLSSDQ